MCNNITLSQEEKFIQLIDKYITQHRDDAINAVFYRKLYVLFVGYHLKYYYSLSNTVTRVFMSIILCRCSQV